MKNACTDTDLEAVYIGAAMCDPQVLIKHPISIDTLSRQAHRQLLEALLSMVARGVDVAPMSLSIEIDRLGYGALKAREDPYAKLARVCLDAESVAARLRDLATLRALHEKLVAAASMCEAGESVLAVQATLREAEAIADRAEEDRTSTSGLNDAVAECIQTIVRVNDHGACITCPSGFDGLEWDMGDLVVVAGDPSAGKSTTMLLAALAQADAGHRPGVISLEDSRERWGRRATAALTGINVAVLKGGKLSDDHWAQINVACSDNGPAKRLKIQFAYPLGGTIDEVIACVRRMRHEHHCDIVYVDYLQAIAGGMGDDKQVRHHIRDCLEALRRELGAKGTPLTIIVGAQYRKRDDETKRPVNADLYEAAYIHQKADAIAHIWKDKSAVRHVWLGKHKDGAELHAQLFIDPDTKRLVTQSERQSERQPEMPPIESYSDGDFVDDEVRYRS